MSHSLRVRFNACYLWIGLDWVRKNGPMTNSRVTPSAIHPGINRVHLLRRYPRWTSVSKRAAVLLRQRLDCCERKWRVETLTVVSVIDCAKLVTTKRSDENVFSLSYYAPNRHTVAAATETDERWMPSLHFADGCGAGWPQSSDARPAGDRRPRRLHLRLRATRVVLWLNWSLNRLLSVLNRSFRARRSAAVKLQSNNTNCRDGCFHKLRH